MAFIDKDYLIAFSHFLKIGPARLKKIKNYFPSWQAAYTAPITELTRAGLEEKISDEFISFRNNLNLQLMLKKLSAENIQTVTLEDDNYPPLLKEIFYPPFLLYYRGDIAIGQLPSVAVIGARKCTFYGQQIIEKIIPELVSNKLIITSGLAVGIDSLAALATVNAGGKSIAVLGSGLDKSSIYPAQNVKLAEKIIDGGGAVVSEFPPGTPPLKQNFPQRNRIIAGIAKATLVVEATEKSGSLITARFALDEGREVMAVPGNIFSVASEGPNNLIKSGAKPITTAADILESFGISKNNEQPKLPLDLSIFNAEEQKILKLLSREPTYINELIQSSKLDTKIINSTLTILEIKKAVKNTGNSGYILNL